MPSYFSGGANITSATQIADGIITEVKLDLADNTTANVSITKHGLCPKAPNSTSQFLRGDGSFAALPIYSDCGLAISTSTGDVITISVPAGSFDTGDLMEVIWGMTDNGGNCGSWSISVSGQTLSTQNVGAAGGTVTGRLLIGQNQSTNDLLESSGQGSTDATNVNIQGTSDTNIANWITQAFDVKLVRNTETGQRRCLLAVRKIKT